MTKKKRAMANKNGTAVKLRKVLICQNCMILCFYFPLQFVFLCRSSVFHCFTPLPSQLKGNVLFSFLSYQSEKNDLIELRARVCFKKVILAARSKKYTELEQKTTLRQVFFLLYFLVLFFSTLTLGIL